MNDFLKRAGEKVSGIAGAAATPMALVYVAGEVGVSAVGLTTGIAALGAGAMFVGVGAIGVAGIAGYYGGKAIYNAAAEYFSDDEEEKNGSNK